MSFSERYGYKEVNDAIQLTSMDESLRNGLWSILCIFVWDHARSTSSGFGSGYFLSSPLNGNLQVLSKRLWFSYFKLPIDKLETDWLKVRQRLERHFFDCEWHEAYDFVEFIANNYEGRGFKDSFAKACNEVLESENSAYRLVDGFIVRITNAQEIAAIERAQKTAINPVATHLHRALEFLADRKSPDYRNSIKESISALESLIANTLNVEKGTLGQLIKQLGNDSNVHPALRDAISNLYGYSCDEKGIRHALIEKDNAQYEDAQFLLVICSALVSFVQTKLPPINSTIKKSTR